MTTTTRTHITIRPRHPHHPVDEAALTETAEYLHAVADGLDRAGHVVHTVEVESRGTIHGRLHLRPNPQAHEERVLHWTPSTGWASAIVPLSPGGHAHHWSHLTGEVFPTPESVAAFMDRER